jgi:hypothetical protein
MARIKYYYDTETCNYESVKTSRWNVFFDLLGFLAASLAVATGIFWGYTTYFDFPQEAQLRRENDLLKFHYSQILREIDKSNHVLAYLQDQDDSLYRMILEVEPMPCAVRQAGIGGINRYQR